LHWLQKNIRQQWILAACALYGILNLCISNVVTDIIGCAVLAVVILVYQAMRKQHAKKKLVYTARVKRLITTDVILALCVWGLVVGLGGIRLSTGILQILTGLQVVLLVVTNVINHPIEAGVSRYYINDAKRKLREVKGLTVIGVTGSYGKTSVKFYLQTLLQDRFNVLVTPESYNTPMGVVRTIRESLKPTHEIFVCEMGARHVGDIKEICDIVHPHHGIITSVGPQHLETFFNMENIKNTKFELADALPADGMLFLNGDNEHIQDKAAGYQNKIFYYSEGNGAGYCASDLKLSRLGTEFTVTAPDGESERFQMRLVGAHNVINVMGAIAVAHSLGISLKELRVPVRRIEPVEHRMQLREHGAVTVIDDAYNSNPVGSKAAVETLAMFEGVRILITPGMVELGEKEAEYNYKFGTYAADCCDYILLVGKKHTEPIREGVLSKGFPEEKCLVYDRLEEAVSYAYAIREQAHKYILLENDLPDNY
ncbi:MAG: UDP-N-acetylmuramoyl-tripeptide--D-alanyl-D-alanine ligase, partial [Lachnospiraceae bacterium]|nr:UDP-N-acetylmuramoyl-tripeptide--D-alanyl-D-alanine ligase [Lachnospiraceae bacterium]